MTKRLGSGTASRACHLFDPLPDLSERQEAQDIANERLIQAGQRGEKLFGLDERPGAEGNDIILDGVLAEKVGDLFLESGKRQVRHLRRLAQRHHQELI